MVDGRQPAAGSPAASGVTTGRAQPDCLAVWQLSQPASLACCKCRHPAHSVSPSSSTASAPLGSSASVSASAFANSPSASAGAGSGAGSSAIALLPSWRLASVPAATIARTFGPAAQAPIFDFSETKLWSVYVKLWSVYVTWFCFALELALEGPPGPLADGHLLPHA